MTGSWWPTCAFHDGPMLHSALEAAGSGSVLRGVDRVAGAACAAVAVSADLRPPSRSEHLRGPASRLEELECAR